MRFNAYYNGSYCKADDVRIPLSDRAIYFADGIYEAMIGRNDKIFMLDEHVERFYSNVKFMDIPFSMNKAELKAILDNVIKGSGEKSFFLYFQLTRHGERRTHAYPDTEKSNLLVTVSPFSVTDNKETLRLISAEDNRHGLCAVKTLNLLPSVLASKKAEASGCDEAVYIKDGFITECSHSNIHIVKNGCIITRPLDGTILPGISRLHLLRVCHKLSVEVTERPFTYRELTSADGVIVTSSSKIAASATEIDGIKIPSSPLAVTVARRMKDEFLSLTI